MLEISFRLSLEDKGKEYHVMSSRGISSLCFRSEQSLTAAHSVLCSQSCGHVEADMLTVEDHVVLCLILWIWWHAAPDRQTGCPNGIMHYVLTHLLSIQTPCFRGADVLFTDGFIPHSLKRSAWCVLWVLYKVQLLQSTPAHLLRDSPTPPPNITSTITTVAFGFANIVLLIHLSVCNI